jgi:hypothetical protein
MDNQPERGARDATVQDTIGLLGAAFILFVMFSSVAASREPDWPLFWLSLAALLLGIGFYGRCARAIRALLEDMHARRQIAGRFDAGAD